MDPHEAEALRGALEAAADGLAVFDAEDRLRFRNGRFAALNAPAVTLLTQGQPWEIVARELARRGLLPAPEGVSDAIWLHRLIDAPAVLEDRGETFALRRADGAHLRLALRPTESGGFVAALADVTADLRAREAERQAETLLERVLDACPAPILMARAERGDILYSNPAWRSMFGRRETAFDLYANPEGRADFLTELLATGEVHAFEMSLLDAARSAFPGAVSARMVEHLGEEVIVSTTVDLTAQKRSEAELARQTEVMLQTEKLSALGELLAGVSHELNNPLSLVVGQTQMLEEERGLPEAARARIGKISAAAERCARIVRTFLAMARQRPTVMAPVDLSETLEAALDVAGHGLRSLGARVEREFAADLPPAFADADQIAQVAVNLIVNAEQALGRRGRAARLALRTRAEGDEVIFEVHDNGPGIPDAIRRRIFEPFFTTKAVGEGTGVGLAFCHRIVQSHGGAIELDTAPGEGACFRVRLPAAEAEAVEAATAPRSPAAEVRRALVAEDEPEVAEMIADILRSDGWTAETALDGAAALARLEADGEGFDLVISDLRMPGLDGRELLQAVRDRAPALVRRFAFVTGDAMGPGADDFLRASGVPHLEKPVAPSELRALARRLVEEPPA